MINTITQKYIHFAPWKTVLPTGPRSDMEVAIDPASGLIAHVGGTGDMQAWLKQQQDKGHQVETIKGGLLMPGLTDAHMHPLLFPMLRAMNAVTLQGMEKAAVFAAIEKAHTTGADPAKPLLFIEMDTSKVKDLSAADLEKLTGGRDTMVLDASLHGGVMSSSLGAKVEKSLDGATGLPGYLKKDGSFSESYGIIGLTILQNCYPMAVFEDQIETDLERSFAKGVTSVHDLLPLSLNSFLAALNVRKKWRTADRGDFPITRFYMRADQVSDLFKELSQLESGGLFSVNDFHDSVGIKLFADGSLGSHTALVSEEYLDHKGYGISFDSEEKMKDAMVIASQLGLKTIAVHAIGDAGISRAIDAARLWKNFSKDNARESRFRIEHYELPTAKILDETKELGCWVVPQPNFLLDARYADRLGERVESISPHREMLARDIRTMFGSDGMPDSMLYALYLATHAKNKSQQIEFMEAFKCSAQTAADFERDNRGSIAVGLKADLVLADPELLSRLSAGDPDIARTVEAVNETVSELEHKVQVVFKSGKQVYSRETHHS